MHKALQTYWTQLDEHRIFARIARGPAPTTRLPFVLVHGLGVSSRYMVPTAVRLSEFAPVYAPDLPGFGKSSHPPRALNIAELAEVLMRWMRAMGIERAVLLGNSMGCQIIAHIAVAHPEMVERVIFVGPSMDPRAGAYAHVGRLLADVLLELLGSLPLFVADYLRAGILRTITTFRYALRDDTLALYARMTMPMLVVRGARDPIAPQTWAQSLARLLPNGGLAVVPRVAHAVNYNAPDALVELVRDFLCDDRQGHGEHKAEATRA